MSRILIVYGTAYGQTERVAQEIAGVLRDSKHQVNLVRGDRPPLGLTLGDYDGVVVAASVRFGRHQRYIERFVRQQTAWLMTVPSAFVSVCGAMANPAPEAVRIAQGYRDRLLAATGWHPTIARSFAGGLPYTRYPSWVRWMMKTISRRTGGPTDTSRDHDFTDWHGVAQFARQFADLLPANRAVSPPDIPVAAAGPKCDLDERCKP